MNVKELKHILRKLPDDMEIIMQQDAEGNGFSPLQCADWESIYIPNNTHSGEVYSLEWEAHDVCMSHGAWESLKKKTPRCLVLAPVN